MERLAKNKSFHGMKDKLNDKRKKIKAELKSFKASPGPGDAREAPDSPMGVTPPSHDSFGSSASSAKHVRYSDDVQDKNGALEGFNILTGVVKEEMKHRKRRLSHKMKSHSSWKCFSGDHADAEKAAIKNLCFGSITFHSVRVNGLSATGIYYEVQFTADGESLGKIQSPPSVSLPPTWSAPLTKDLNTRLINACVRLYDSDDKQLGFVELELPLHSGSLTMKGTLLNDGHKEKEDHWLSDIASIATTGHTSERLQFAPKVVGDISLDISMKFSYLTELKQCFTGGPVAPTMPVPDHFSMTTTMDCALRLVSHVPVMLYPLFRVIDLVYWTSPWQSLAVWVTLTVICWCGLVLPSCCLGVLGCFAWGYNKAHQGGPVHGLLDDDSPEGPQRANSKEELNKQKSKEKSKTKGKHESATDKIIIATETVTEGTTALAFVTGGLSLLANVLDIAHDLVLWKDASLSLFCVVMISLGVIATWMVSFDMIVWFGVTYVFTIQTMYLRFPLFYHRFPLTRLMYLPQEVFGTYRADQQFLSSNAESADTSSPSPPASAPVGAKSFNAPPPPEAPVRKRSSSGPPGTPGSATSSFHGDVPATPDSHSTSNRGSRSLKKARSSVSSSSASILGGITAATTRLRTPARPYLGIVRFYAIEAVNLRERDDMELVIEPSPFISVTINSQTVYSKIEHEDSSPRWEEELVHINLFQLPVVAHVKVWDYKAEGEEPVPMGQASCRIVAPWGRKLPGHEEWNEDWLELRDQSGSTLPASIVSSVQGSVHLRWLVQPMAR
eukprot:TRINITY_DN67653_c6_g1_i4.p1 TRINITY_DN67653_c6_g1~~TRINITY_DN67653_c6_g1_i4.p1  ORF type:complete len:784 (-),score=6.73 TRINITY_DN67653_c6_g1_i4:599-2950(-)